MANDKSKLPELRQQAEALCKEYNDAIQNGKYEAATKVAEATEKVINEYTSIVRTMCFDECKASDDPLRAAVTMLTYTTIATKDEKVDEDKVPVRSIVDKERPIDLLKLHKYVGGDGIGADKAWPHIAQKMNFTLTAQAAKELGIDPKKVNDSYSMSDIAAQYDLGKNPASNTNLLKTLQTVITAMLGEGAKATSHDVAFLKMVYAKKNRQALTVTCANHRYFVNYIAEICHRIVTGKSYEVAFKAKKGA